MSGTPTVTSATDPLSDSSPAYSQRQGTSSRQAERAP
jgi:hypothetical protein